MRVCVCVCVYERQVRFVHDKKLIDTQTGSVINNGPDNMSARAKVKGSAYRVKC